MQTKVMKQISFKYITLTHTIPAKQAPTTRGRTSHAYIYMHFIRDINVFYVSDFIYVPRSDDYILNAWFVSFLLNIVESVVRLVNNEHKE